MSTLHARIPLLAGLAIATAGCYHATIDTGLPNSLEVIDERWASGWVLGLVPPKTVETARGCRHGTAQVETKLGFLNQLVGMATLGVYTPMHVRVTCAGPSTEAEPDPTTTLSVAPDAPSDVVLETFDRAARAAASGEVAVVRFEG